MTDMYSKKAGSLLNYFDCKKKSSSSESIPSNSICQNVKSSHISEQSVTTKGQGHVNDFPEDDLDFMMDDEDWNEADFMEPDKKKFKIWRFWNKINFVQWTLFFLVILLFCNLMQNWNKPVQCNEHYTSFVR